MVGEKSIIEFGKNRHLMGILVDLVQILAMLLKSSSFVPTLSHSRIILPLIEQPQMLIVFIVQSPKRKELVQVWNVTTVDTRSWSRLCRSNGMNRMHTNIRKLGRQSMLNRE